MAAWNRVGPAVGDFFPVGLPAFPAEKARAHFALAAPDSAAALRRLAAGNGNSGLEAPAAAPRADIESLNIAAGRQAAGPAEVQSCDSSCPIRFDAAPMHRPSAHPSAAARPNATREST